MPNSARYCCLETVAVLQMLSQRIQMTSNRTIHFLGKQSPFGLGNNIVDGSLHLTTICATTRSCRLGHHRLRRKNATSTNWAHCCHKLYFGILFIGPCQSGGVERKAKSQKESVRSICFKLHINSMHMTKKRGNEENPSTSLARLDSKRFSFFFGIGEEDANWQIRFHLFLRNMGVPIVEHMCVSDAKQCTKKRLPAGKRRIEITLLEKNATWEWRWQIMK